MAILQIRVDDELKNQANAIYNELGMDISTAVRMFLKRSVVVGGIPFDTRVNSQASTVSRVVDDMPNSSMLLEDSPEMQEEINDEIKRAREERRKRLQGN